VKDNTTGDCNIAHSRWTTAVNLKREMALPQAAQVDFDAAYQFGTMGYSTGEADIAAWMLAGDFAYNLLEDEQVWVGLGFHFTSATTPNEPDKITWFYDKYASLHKIHGAMDLFKDFTGIKSHGMREIILRMRGNATKDITCKLDVHHFMVGEDFESRKDASMANVLGQEFDASVNWKMREGLSTQIGYSFFLPSEDWLGSEADMAAFAYCMILLKL
jgi:hypothetical protein